MPSLSAALLLLGTLGNHSHHRYLSAATGTPSFTLVASRSRSLQPTITYSPLRLHCKSLQAAQLIEPPAVVVCPRTLFMNMADDLATIAVEQDRLISLIQGANTLIDPNNLNWLLKKLGDNTGLENGTAGRLQELSHFAKIMRESRELDPSKISDFSFERWIGAKISSDADTDSWTDADILEKLRMWFYETKTTLAAAKGKITGKQGSHAGVDSIFNEEWSGLFYKLMVYFKKIDGTGKTPRFELGADLGNETSSNVTDEIVEAIEKLGKKMKLNEATITKYQDAIVVVHIPRKYRKQ